MSEIWICPNCNYANENTISCTNCREYFNSQMTAPADKPQALPPSRSDLQLAQEILDQYAMKDSIVDQGNLYFAACAFQSALAEKDARIKELEEALRGLLKVSSCKNGCPPYELLNAKESELAEAKEAAKLAYELLNAKEAELVETKALAEKDHDHMRSVVEHLRSDNSVHFLKINKLQRDQEADRVALEKAIEALSEIAGSQRNSLVWVSNRAYEALASIEETKR